MGSLLKRLFGAAPEVWTEQREQKDDQIGIMPEAYFSIVNISVGSTSVESECV
jgi:hypothetical protein